jgi:Arc/MetJ-type ribon-helix-helix transcriptional regulator
MPFVLPFPPCDPLAMPTARYAECMTIQIAIRLPDELVRGVDRLVERGRFASRTDAVRAALERLVTEAHQTELDEAIVAGYRRLPDAAAEPWVEAAARAMVQEEPW